MNVKIFLSISSIMLLFSIYQILKIYSETPEFVMILILLSIMFFSLLWGVTRHQVTERDLKYSEKKREKDAKIKEILSKLEDL